MTEKNYTVKDLISFVAAGNAADFQIAFDQLASQRAAETVDTLRADVAKTFITPETEQEGEVTDEDPEAATE
jgi:predicted patatin/cPLA2 family phospholipase